MPLSNDITIRLVVWEGVLWEGPSQKKQIKDLNDGLKRLINEAVEEKDWVYQKWKLYPSQNETQKFEVSIRHKHVEDELEKSIKIHQLCDRLLNSELATNLRLEFAAASFTFSPSREGTVTENDLIFARCFSTAVVRRYCLGDAYSKELARRRDEFLSRNSTRYLHQTMRVMYDAADFIELYRDVTLQLVGAVEWINGDMRTGFELTDAAAWMLDDKLKLSDASEAFHKFASQAVPSAAKWAKPTVPVDQRIMDAAASQVGAERNREAARLLLAIGCQLVRAFVAQTEAIKKELAPLVKDIDQAMIQARLALASDAYMTTASAPILALRRLHEQDSPTADDLAMTINAFGCLMQTTLPLFDVTVAMTGKEYATVARWIAGAGAGLITAGGVGVWMTMAGVTAGPLGFMAIAGLGAVAMGAKALQESWRWGDRQQTNPTTVLLTIQKVMEQCALFLLSLLFVKADMSPDDDKSHLHYVQALRNQLGTENTDRLLKKEYQRAYFKNTSEQLAKEMDDLKTGLERYRKTTISASTS